MLLLIASLIAVAVVFGLLTTRASKVVRNGEDTGANITHATTALSVYASAFFITSLLLVGLVETI